MSGILFHHYHPDKIRMITTLLRLSDNNQGLIIDGGLIYPSYQKVQRLSKTSINYYRNTLGMITRAIDAVSQGTIPIAAKDNIFSLYVPKASQFSFTSLEDVANKIKIAKANSLLRCQHC